ncbi:MAG: PAS domain S-box protein [Oscillatoriales cyanobacterium C42_A2020_001]|nr:PAS domain S-box protein [Leptolyngbyaceae cyanobacterium C42_A2020_001]
MPEFLQPWFLLSLLIFPKLGLLWQSEAGRWVVVQIAAVVAIALLSASRRFAKQPSNASLHRILENLPIMLNAFDAKGTIIVWNQECERVTGYSAKEVVGNPDAMRLFYPDDAYREAMMAQWEEEGSGQCNWEWDLTCKNGSVKTIAWSNISDEYPVPGWVRWGVGIDVSDRKRAENEQRKALTLFQRLIEETPLVAIQGFDQNGIVHYWNQASTTLYGISKTDALGKPLEQLFPTNNWSAFHTLLSQTCELGKATEPMGWTLTTPTGQDVNIYSVMVPITQDDRHTEVFCMDVDITQRIWAEQALRDSEERLRLTLNFTHVGSWDWNIQTGEMTWNDNHFLLMGLLPTESSVVQREIWRDRIHPDDQPIVEQAFAQALNTQTDYEVEYRILHPNGTLHWVLDRGHPLYNEQGEPVRMLGILLDISDRKHAELQIRQLNEALEQQNQTLEALVEQRTSELSTLINNLPEYIFVVERDTMRIPFCNDLLAKSAGFSSRTDVQGKTIFECFSPADAAYFAEQNRQVFDSGEIFHTQEKLELPSGTLYLDTYKIPLKRHNGETYALIGTSRDFTELALARQELMQQSEELRQTNQQLQTEVWERQRAETALRQSEELLRQIFDNAPLGIALAKISTYQFVMVNNAFCEMLGYTPTELMENSCPTISHPDDAELEKPSAEKMLQGEIPGYQLVKRYIRKDNHIIWGNLTTRTIRSETGEVLYALGMVDDITQRKHAQDALAKRTTELEAINRELESFSYSVSHDLRAPLRHIGGFVAALSNYLQQTGATSDPKVAHYLQVIGDSSKRMGLLIDGLLTLSRVGRRQIEHHPVNLLPLIKQAIWLVKSAQTSDEATQFVIGNLPVVRGDATLLQQVFSNLIDNAVKFSRLRRPARVEVGTLPDGTIYVRDNGVGFDMEYADQLFGAFQRLHSNAEYEGTGIGLAIVQRIIHRHGGRIWAESKLEQGSCFYLRLEIDGQEECFE